MSADICAVLLDKPDAQRAGSPLPQDTDPMQSEISLHILLCNDTLVQKPLKALSIKQRHGRNLLLLSEGT
jgi:hypothetical protein